MGSFVKWQARLVEAIKTGDQEVIDYCQKIFPKDIEGKPGALYQESVTKAKQELENKKPKNTNKTVRKTSNTRPRRKKKDDNSESNN